MIVGRIEGATHTLAENQDEYHSLPIRLEIRDVAGVGPAPTMTSAWFPTPAELEALNAGAPVHLTLLCRRHPPVILSVGAPPEAGA